MKTLDPKLIERLLRQQQVAARKSIRSSGIRKRRRLLRAMTPVPQRVIRKAVPERLRYYAPRDTRRVVDAFFEDVDNLLRAGRRVVIDFSTVQRLFPCGVLILMGWVDEWVRLYPGRVTATYPKDDLVEQMLQHVRVLQKLGLTERKEVFHNDVTRWHYFHGRDADATDLTPVFRTP